MDNTFSIKRFYTFAAAELGAARRVLTVGPAVIGGVMLLLYLLQMLKRGFISEISPTQFESTHNFCVTMITLYVLMNISTVFFKYHNTRTAAAAMLLPVSKCEKFTYAFLFSLVALPLVVSLVDFVAFTAMSHIYGMAAEVNYFESGVQTMGSLATSSVIGFAYLSSFFFGAALFRRRQLIYTLLWQLAIGAVFVFGFVFAIGIMHQNAYDFVFSYQLADWAKVLISLGFLVLFVSLSWWRFKKLQLR